MAGHEGHHAMSPIVTTMATMVNAMQGMDHAHHMDHHEHMGHVGQVDPHAGHTTSDPHAGHVETGHGDHMDHMIMWFHTGYTETVLFKSWSFDTIGGLIGSMIGIFFMAALYEGIKYYREYLFWKTYNALQYRSVTIPTEKGVVSEDNQIVHMVGEMIHKQPPTMFSWMHVFQTFLHMIQMVLSYFLMLIFMTYNIWLCVAVVLGAAVGFFLFGWKKSVIVDVTEHCH